jgi:hypothetical protein
MNSAQGLTGDMLMANVILAEKGSGKKSYFIFD